VFPSVQSQICSFVPSALTSSFTSMHC
jgi:hypothetical protein